MQKMAWTTSLIAVLGAIALLTTLMISADEPQATMPPAQPTPVALQACDAQVMDILMTATDACIGQPQGFVCNGGTAPLAQPQGAVSNSLAAVGALVPMDDIDAINTGAFTDAQGGVAWLRVEETGMNALIIGDTTVTNTIAPEQAFPKWMAFTVATGENAPACTTAPPNVFIAQNADIFTPIRFVVNGVSVDLSGTVMVYTETDGDPETHFIALEGIVRIIALGVPQTIVTGQQSAVVYDARDWTFPLTEPDFALPYTPGALANVPDLLLDRAISLPQPGFVATDGPVNLRVGPSIQTGIIYQVPGGQTMTILGQNPAGDWYHVRLASGVTGWMFADLLRRNHGAINAVYESTPQPPQRLGDAGRLAFVSTDNVTMRSAPSIYFAPILNLTSGTPMELVARSPYSQWIKVDASGTVGWVPLLNIETQAILDSIPVDFNVPDPPNTPEPTRVPGTFGFAFPDPSCFPDC
jgi:SH3-like domain-containing protein